MADTREATFCPPQRVQNMRELTEEGKLMFRKEVMLPAIIIPANHINRLVGSKIIFDRTIKRLSNRIKPIADVPSTSSKCILFDPGLVNEETCRAEILKNISQLTDLSSVQFEQRNLTIEYEDWTAKQCINAILPNGLLFSGFSQVGHIVHVNLREELLPYKLAIGKILLEKTNNCRTVVNKLESIENEYRVFELDLLAGEPDYEAEVREGGIRYKLDFSKVFWNSRLSSEHDRIVRQFNQFSAVFDCCAGVGPFVLPAAKRGAPLILANDLNPESVKWLKTNIELNKSKTSKNEIQVFCMDACDFISTVVAQRIAEEAERYKRTNESTQENDEKSNHQKAEIREVHLLMNLPAMSLTFLPQFRGLLTGLRPDEKLPFSVLIHCHLFVKAHQDEEESWYAEEAKRLVADSLGCPEMRFKNVHFVRKVAGRKEMYCVSFELSNELLFKEVVDGNRTSETCEERGDSRGDSDSKKLNDIIKTDDLSPPQKMAKLQTEGENS
ncbi:unnamed protein product [Anisakis simplex]|uniref:tRNA (guanine(37)-N1)-methyltransferase n=1 Tax=Anisakis simplex TaxID=6269 RepID=A0A0M3K2X2_ANISI|nr:unnamed protein product [Anisakis simplex]